MASMSSCPKGFVPLSDVELTTIMGGLGVYNLHPNKGNAYFTAYRDISHDIPALPKKDSFLALINKLNVEPICVPIKSKQRFSSASLDQIKEKYQ